MYCESLYNLNFESDLMNGFFWNSSGLVESRRIDVTGPVGQLSKDQPKDQPSKNELAKDSTKKKIRVLEPKSTAALKSHSEAERRRRERINAHLETLRGLVPPSKEKLDKATLLAEVITQVKNLRTIAKQAAEGLHIPMDTNDVQVEILDNNDPFLLRASLCCDQSPELFPDLRKAINDIPVRVLKCEVSTLEGRMKFVFLLTCTTELEKGGDHEVIASNVRAALCNILDKISAAAEYAQPLSFPRKRKMSF